MMSPYTALAAATPDETPTTVSTAPQFLQQLLQHRPALERFIEHYLSRSGADAQAMRLIFRQASATRAALQGAAALASWQYGMALNVARQLMLAQEPSRYCQSEQARAARQTVRAELAQALAGLPYEVREVLMLLASGAMPIDQAALMAALSLSAVRGHIAACRQPVSAESACAEACALASA